METDLLESYWGVSLGDPQGAAKVEIAFGADRAASKNDADCRRDGVERDTGAGNQRPEQHVAGARTRPIATGGRVQPGGDECLAGLNVASDPFADTVWAVKVISAASGRAL